MKARRANETGSMGCEHLHLNQVHHSTRKRGLHSFTTRLERLMGLGDAFGPLVLRSSERLDRVFGLPPTWSPGVEQAPRISKDCPYVA